MNVEYFIKKFEAIPEENWSIGSIQDTDGNSCANGHCGVLHLGHGYIVLNKVLTGVIRYRTTDESRALQKVFSKLEITQLPGISYEMFYEEHFQYSVTAAIINNGHAAKYQQETPKQRILAALRDIQLLEEQDRAVEIAQVAADTKLPDDIDPIIPPSKHILDCVFLD